jgi:hypothetical protein
VLPPALDSRPLLRFLQTRREGLRSPAEVLETAGSRLGSNGSETTKLRGSRRAAPSPTEQARIGRIETFNTDQVEVNLAEDRERTRRRIEYFDGNGACYVTIFAGPLAAQRARLFRSPQEWAAKSSARIDRNS